MHWSRVLFKEDFYHWQYVDIKYWHDRWKQSFRIWDMFGGDEKGIYWLSKEVSHSLLLSLLLHTQYFTYFRIYTWLCCSTLQLMYKIFVYVKMNHLSRTLTTTCWFWSPFPFSSQFKLFTASLRVMLTKSSTNARVLSGGQTSQQWFASHFMTVLVTFVFYFCFIKI